MKRLRNIIALMGLLAGLVSPAFSLEVIKKDDLELNVGGRMQVFGLGQNLKDPYREDSRVYLFMKQARLMFDGKYEDYKYYVELAFAGEDEVQNKNSALGLLEYRFDVPLGDSASVRVGQFRIPYSREHITSSGELQFADRSIQNLAFRPGYDVGTALQAYKGNLAGVFGVFTGGGRDVPERYLPEKLGFPVVVARVGINNGLDQDIFTLSQTDHVTDHVKTAFFANGLYMKDTLIGHSTVINVKTSEKSLLLNSNWNPFVGRSPYDKGDLWQAGADAALRAPLGGFILSAELEGNRAEYTNNYGTLDVTGGRAQIGLYKKPVEVAVQYAVVVPDKFAFYDATTKKTFQIAGRKTIQEITPSLTYHLKKFQKAKVILDAPILTNVPTFIEKGLGTYVSTEQPDQATVAATGKVKLQTVTEVRMLFQVGF